MHTKVLRNMKHYIKTAVGISEGYIKFAKEKKKLVRNGAIMILTGMIGGVTSSLAAAYEPEG